MVQSIAPHKSITVDFVQIPHAEAMDKYGSDKPDLRFGMEFVDVSSCLVDCEF